MSPMLTALDSCERKTVEVHWTKHEIKHIPAWTHGEFALIHVIELDKWLLISAINGKSVFGGLTFHQVEDGAAYMIEVSRLHNNWTEAGLQVYHTHIKTLMALWSRYRTAPKALANMRKS